MVRALALAVVLLVAPAVSLRLKIAPQSQQAPKGLRLKAAINQDLEADIAPPEKRWDHDLSGKYSMKEGAQWGATLPKINIGANLPAGSQMRQLADTAAFAQAKIKADKKVATDKYLYTVGDGLQQHFENKHVVFIGDSVSHFNYINLCYNLLHKHPPNEEFTEWKVVQSDWDRARKVIFADRGWDQSDSRELGELSNLDAWKVAYNATTEKLTDESQGIKEVCDCWRDHGEPEMVQNRYFTMPKKNAAVTFLTWQTDVTPLHGHWSPEMGYPVDPGCLSGSCAPPFKWSVNKATTGDGMLQLVENYVMKMKPTPTHVVFNHGNWGHLSEDKLHKLMGQGKFFRERKQGGPRFIWQTATKRKFGEQDKPYFHQIHPEIPKYSPQEYEDLIGKERNMANSYGWEVFDLDLISEELEARLEDDYHYDEQVKTFFNGKFVQQFMTK